MSPKTKNLTLAIAVIATHAVVNQVFANTSANRRHRSAFISLRSLGSTLSDSAYFNRSEPHLRPCSTFASKRQSYNLWHRLESSSSSDTISGNNNNHDFSSGSNGILSKEVKIINKDSRSGYSGNMGIEKAISENNGKSSVEDMANQLRERAKSLRLEANSAEQSLRNAVQAKQERDSNEADGWIDLLLGFSTSSSSTNDISKDRNDTTKKTMKSVPAPKTLALRIQEYKLLSSNKLYKIVKRLHDRETKARIVGVEGALLASDISAESATIESTISRGSEEKTTNKVLNAIMAPGRGFILGDYENNSLERKKEESEIISGLLDSLLEAVAILEEEKDANFTVSSFSGGDSGKLASKLKAKVADLRLRNEEIIRRKVDNLILSSNKAVKNQTGNNDLTKGGNGSSSLDDLIRSSMQGNKNSNSTQERGDKRKKYEKMMKRLIETPEWLPASIAPFAATSPVEIAASDWKRVKTDLFSSQYLELRCSSWDYTDVAAVYRVKLPKRHPSSREGGSLASSNDEKGRNKSSIKDAFNEICRRLENHHDLSKKIQLFLVDDNEWKPSFDTATVYERGGGGWASISQEDLGPPPVIIALAKEVTPEQESERTLTAKSLVAFSTILTLFTTFAYALSSYALNPTFFNSVVRENDITPVPMCLPVFFGVLSLSALHEIGHLVAAKKYDVKLGSPVPLPSLQVGTFGSITPLRSFPPSRTALFDIAISGPLVSMLASLVMIVSGLKLTIGSESFANFPVLPAAIMRSSFLVGSIASVVAPKVMLAPLSQPLPIHPFFVIGLAGLIVSAINLLPIGRLDGGRTCMASWGRRAANTLSLLTLLGLTFYSLSGTSLVILFWGAIVVLSQRQPDIPSVDEFTNIGSVRENCYAALLTIALLTLAPFPGGGGPI